MRFAPVALALACAACFDAAHDEYIPVRVPVCREPGMDVAVSVAPAAPAAPSEPSALSSEDPCDAPPPSITTCTPMAYVRAGPITTQPHCYLDTKIRAGEVGRLMRCPRGALIVFEHATFVGDSADGYVNVCKSTTYDFPQGDDCTWRTEQRIEGSLSGALSFSYVEGPVAGASCTLACRARSTLEVLR